MSSPPRALVLVMVAALATACRGGPGSALPAPTTGVGPAAPSPSTAAPAGTAGPVNGAAPAWRALRPAPTARQEVASAVLDGRVWVIGGITTGGASALVESYDPATDRWSGEPTLPVALHHAAAAVYRGEIVVAGGFLAGASLYARASDRVLALRKGNWVDLPPLRRPRGAAGAAVVGGALIVAGGRDATALIGPTETFDGAAWQDGAPILTRRDHLSAVSDGASVFTVGGRFLAPGAISAAFERYDPATGTWERLAAMPTERAGQGATLAGGRVIVAGGEAPSRVFPQVEAYDIVAQSWAVLAPLPTPRHGLALERLGTEVLALVGGAAFGVAPSTGAEALGPLS